jgi:tRNA (guanine37-N1)-methyltransferase
VRFDIITIFPNIFDSYLNESILKRAQKRKLIRIKIHNLRDFVPKRGLTRTERGITRKNNYLRVDDRPYGGGPGMVMRIEPLIRAVQSLKSKIKNKKSKTKVILFSPAGKQFDNKTAVDLAKKYDNLILICGRYEGIDARAEKVIKNLKLKIENLSIGPYVLTGGELPAMVLVDAVSRRISGVLGKKESLEEKRFGVGLPVYTRPEIFVHKGKKYRVPKILLSGNHKKIEEWRRRHAT